MTPTQHPVICDGCGKNSNVLEVEGNELCQECRDLAEAIATNPGKVARIIKLAKLDISEEALLDNQGKASAFKGLPEVLDAVRFRTRDCDLNRWYVSISEIEGKPVEIFASTAFDKDRHLQSRISNLTTITRLISLILRHVFLGEVLTLEKIIKQLQRSSRQQHDLPDMLTGVLSKYSPIHQKMSSGADQVH